MLKPKSGKVSYLEHNLLTTPSHKIVQYGLAHVPEGRRVFAQMTVQENLEMGAYISNDKVKKKNLDNVFAHFPRLEERKKTVGGHIERRRTADAGHWRWPAMASPDMLLLDEPSMGLSPLLVKEIFKIIEELNQDGMTILLVEQNAKKRYPFPTEAMYWKPVALC